MQNCYNKKHCNTFFHIFQFCETSRNIFFVFLYFFQFRKVNETRQKNNLFRTVSCFAEIKTHYHKNLAIRNIQSWNVSIRVNLTRTRLQNHSCNIFANMNCRYQYILRPWNVVINLFCHLTLTATDEHKNVKTKIKFEHGFDSDISVSIIWLRCLHY